MHPLRVVKVRRLLRLACLFSPLAQAREERAVGFGAASDVEALHICVGVGLVGDLALVNRALAHL